jgi:hypothetical protein
MIIIIATVNGNEFKARTKIKKKKKLYIKGRYKSKYSSIFNHVSPNQKQNANLMSELSCVEFPPSCGMRAGLINARSSVANVRELRLLCSKYHFDVIGVTETFLRDAIPNAFVCMDGYSLISCDRTRGRVLSMRYCINRDLARWSIFWFLYLLRVVIAG